MDGLDAELDVMSAGELVPLLEGKVSLGDILIWLEGRATPARVRVIKVAQSS